MTIKPKKIAVGIDPDQSWHVRFVDALEARVAQGQALEYALVDFDRSDWLDAVAGFDAVLWKSPAMGIEASNYFKERILILERHLKKTVVPGFETVWHFESKVAQSYLFQLYGIRTPATSVSFSTSDARNQLERARLPLVFKRSHGAASSHVNLVADKARANELIDRAFSKRLWFEHKRRGESKIKRLISGLRHPWFRAQLLHHFLGTENSGVVYWQDFVPGNSADLRVTVIGNRCAFGFWRRNRPGDFRASGSGDIDYETKIPEAALNYCIEISRRLRFDSMAYDILFRDDVLFISEMSYGYLDTAIYDSPGYFERMEDGTLRFQDGHVWPQMLWVDWLLERMRAEDDPSNRPENSRG